MRDAQVDPKLGDVYLVRLFAVFMAQVVGVSLYQKFPLKMTQLSSYIFKSLKIKIINFKKYLIKKNYV